MDPRGKESSRVRAYRGRGGSASLATTERSGEAPPGGGKPAISRPTGEAERTVKPPSVGPSIPLRGPPTAEGAPPLASMVHRAAALSMPSADAAVSADGR